MASVTTSSPFASGSSNTCGLTTIPANAVVKMGDITVKTPDIINIGVSRSRGDLIGKAQLQFHFNNNTLTTSENSNIVIYFFNQIVFTGSVKRIDISPSFRCAGEYIIRVQAEDCMNRIQGRAITRRQKHSGLGPIAFIGSIYKRTTVGFDNVRDLHDISGTGSDITIFTHTVNMAEQTQFIRGGESNTSGALHPVTKVADIIGNVGKGTSGGTGGFILHDHSTLDTTGDHAGGPAFAVYGVK